MKTKENDMFGTLTDIPKLSTYEQALAHFNDVKPIAGKGVNAGVRPLCGTPSGRKKTQYSMRKSESAFTGDGRAIECVLYDTPVVTFTENGRIIIDMNYPSNTTHSFISEILRYYGGYCSYSDNQTWLHCRCDSTSRSWWLPHGSCVAFKIDSTGLIIEPVTPKLMKRYEVNRSKARAVYAKYAAFTAHCVTISKLVDPKVIFDGHNLTGSILTNAAMVAGVPNPLQTEEPNETWTEAVQQVLARAVTKTYDWNSTSSIPNLIATYKLTPKKVRQVIIDQLKHEHSDEIFDEVTAKAGVFTSHLNEEYI